MGGIKQTLNSLQKTTEINNIAIILDIGTIKFIK